MPLAAAFFVQRHALPAARAGDVGERVAEPLLIGWAVLWWVVTAAIHIDALVAPLDRLAALLACASGVALLHTGLSARLAWSQVSLPVLAFAPVLLFGVAVSALFQPQPLGHGGAWAWPLALAVHAGDAAMGRTGLARGRPPPRACAGRARAGLVRRPLRAGRDPGLG